MIVFNYINIFGFTGSNKQEEEEEVIYLFFWYFIFCVLYSN